MRRWLAAGFRDEASLKAAYARLREAGFDDVDLHSPYPVAGAEALLGLKRSRVRWAALVGGLLGAGGGYLTQWYLNGFDYPINVGGRPLHAAPAFIPFTFEAMVLTSALAVFGALLAATGLPRVYHPVFEVSGFDRASIDSFWLSAPVTLNDPERLALEEALRDLGAVSVQVVTEAES